MFTCQLVHTREICCQNKQNKRHKQKHAGLILLFVLPSRQLSALPNLPQWSRWTHTADRIVFSVQCDRILCHMYRTKHSLLRPQLSLMCTHNLLISFYYSLALICNMTDHLTILLHTQQESFGILFKLLLLLFSPLY